MTYAFRALPDMIVVRAAGPFDMDRALETLRAVQAVRTARGTRRLLWDARRRTTYPPNLDPTSAAAFLDGWERVAILAAPGAATDVARRGSAPYSDRTCICDDASGALRWLRTGEPCGRNALPAPSATPSQRRVLVIDDDPAVRRTLSRILAVGGYEVAEAGDGRAGLAALSAGRVDLVITDLHMPGMEGIETIQRIREVGAEIPIIAISGGFEDSEFSSLEDARLMGADLAVGKPFSVVALLDSVGTLLAR